MRSPTTREPSGPLDALRYRDFRLFWAGSAISMAGTQMQQVGVAWQVYLLTHSPLALGAIGIVRVAPIVVFSLWGGVVADARSRKALLLATQSLFMLTSAVLGVATFTGHIGLPLIYGMILISASTAAFSNPARQALIPSLIPPGGLANALSLNTTAQQVATVAGPTVGGVVIAAFGVGNVYVVDVLSFVAILAALLLIHPPPIAGSPPQVSLGAAKEGLRFVLRSPIILSTMGLDFIATFFGSATALLPIFARDILHVGAQGYGVLYASPSIGALAAGVLMTFVSHRIRRQGWTIIGAVGAYAVCTILFGLSRDFLLSLLALAGTGAADTVSMVLRQTIRQLVTPDALRGRMTSVTMVFFMGGPQLGEVEAGAVARLAGAPISVITGGLAALLATALVAYLAGGLRHYSPSARETDSTPM